MKRVGTSHLLGTEQGPLAWFTPSPVRCCGGSRSREEEFGELGSEPSRGVTAQASVLPLAAVDTALSVVLGSRRPAQLGPASCRHCCLVSLPCTGPTWSRTSWGVRLPCWGLSLSPCYSGSSPSCGGLYLILSWYWGQVGFQLRSQGTCSPFRKRRTLGTRLCEIASPVQ